MEIKDIIKLIQAVSENGLTSFQIEDDNMSLTMEKKERKVEQHVTLAGNAAAPMTQQAAAGGPIMSGMVLGGTVSEGIAAGGQIAAAPLSGGYPAGAPGAAAGQTDTGAALETDKIVVSPLVGTFYHSASPEAEPYVKVGDLVKKGQTLGIIEAMKLMNEIECEFDGVVDGILVSNEDVVEYGQPLFRIR